MVCVVSAAPSSLSLSPPHLRMLSALFCCRRRSPSLSYGDACLTLLSVETERPLMNAPSVTTINIYEGRLPANEIRKRVADIIAANPWLASRLLTGRNGKCAMHYSSTPSKDECASHVVEVSISSLGGAKSYEDLAADVTLQALVVGTGASTLDRIDALQFRVGIAYDERAGKSALIFSLSHVMSDGATFYSLYRQLDPCEPIVSLHAERREEATKAINRSADMRWLFTARWMVGMAVNVVWTNLAALRIGWDSRATQIRRVSSIHADTIAQLKAEATSNPRRRPSESSPLVPPFVSTHDLVASSFFHTARMAGNLLVVNMRVGGRAEGVGKELAGNYDAVIVYPLQDCVRPEQIRQSLSTLRCESGNDPAPFSTMHGFALVSNWASFSHNLDDAYAGCTLIEHLPFFLPTVPAMRVAQCCLFRRNKHELAVWTNLPREVDAEWMKHPLLQQPV